IRARLSTRSHRRRPVRSYGPIQDHLALSGYVTDWLSPLAALLGAVVGAVSAILTQRFQWRQQMNQRDRDTRRELYSAYLTALHETGEDLWAIAGGIAEDWGSSDRTGTDRGGA